MVLALSSLEFMAGPGRVIAGFGIGTFDHEFTAAGLGGINRKELLEEQVGEAEVDVRLDLRHLLVRVVRDDPAGGHRLDRQLGGHALHLAGVFHADLRLGRQGQRRPG